MITLSRIRRLEAQTEKQIGAMPITYDIRTDHLYKKRISQGEENIVSSLLEKAQMTVEQISSATGVSSEIVTKLKNYWGK